VVGVEDVMVGEEVAVHFPEPALIGCGRGRRPLATVSLGSLFEVVDHAAEDVDYDAVLVLIDVTE
jgi:hypothetical protein